jgi:hypothetical protein
MRQLAAGSLGVWIVAVAIAAILGWGAVQRASTAADALFAQSLASPYEPYAGIAW